MRKLTPNFYFRLRSFKLGQKRHVMFRKLFDPESLIFDQQAGYWPQVVTWVSARYDKVTDGNPYESVQIFHNGEPVGGANVEVVS